MSLYLIYLNFPFSLNLVSEDEDYYSSANGGSDLEEFNEVTNDVYADFPPTDPKYAYQNIATGEVSSSRPTRPPRPNRPNQRPQFSRPHRPSSQSPIIETFEELGSSNFPPNTGGNLSEEFIF